MDVFKDFSILEIYSILSAIFLIIDLEMCLPLHLLQVKFKTIIGLYQMEVYHLLQSVRQNELQPAL